MGPLPAGDYDIVTSSFGGSADTKLHVEVLFRPSGGADVVVVSADSPAVEPQDGGVLNPGDIKTTVTGSAVPASPGDLLVLHVAMIAGTNAYTEFVSGLHIP